MSTNIPMFKPTVKVQWYTENGDQMIADIARVSVKDNEGKPIHKLVRYMAEHGHNSPFDMANLCVEVHAPRDISRQILRHWSIKPQEFCIAGDSMISIRHGGGKVMRMAIQDLYARQQSGSYDGRRKPLLARVYDEASKLLTYAPIREVFSTGVKPVYAASIGNNKQRVVKATAEHKFLCRDGVFRPLGSIAVGDFVALNGVAVYDTPEWLADAKVRSIETGVGLAGIAAEAGCSTHTIRKKLKKFGMSFTKQEVAQYTPAWNKGLPSEQQPNFGNVTSANTRAKQRDAARRGMDSPLFSGNGGERSFRQRVQDECYKWKLALIRSQNGACASCGAGVSQGDGCEVDHKQPLHAHPDKAFDLDNLQVLCASCHRAKTDGETAQRSMTIHWGRVNSIKYLGEVPTYDMEVDHTSHNYVANGVVVHNSQRYAEVTDEMFVIRETRMKHPTNRQMSVDIDKTNPMDMATSAWWESAQRVNITQTKELYSQAISRGIAKEVARVILPEGNTMSRLFLNGSIRTWIYYLKSRQDISATQREHVWVADRIAELFQAAFPVTYAAFFETTLYSMVHTVSGVSVVRVRTAEDVHRWATVISDTGAEVIVSFQPNHSHCRVTWKTKGTATWCDYNLYPVNEPQDGNSLDMKVENNAK